MEVPMTKGLELSREEQLRQLHHDLQNCLNGISMGTDVLADNRSDDAIYAEFYDLVCDERRTATKLLEQFLKTACEEHG